MKKNKSLKENIEDQATSTMDDVKSGYKNVEEKTAEAVIKAKDDVVEWAEDGASKIKQGAHDFSENAKETFQKTAKSIDKNVKHGMSQYNAKAQEVADKVPGGFGDTVIRYPWVAISIGVLLGIVLGILFKPTRNA